MALNTQQCLFDIEAAKKINPVFLKRLNLLSNPPWGLDPASDDFAWKVFEFQLIDPQVNHGLKPLVNDGIYGPKTHKAFLKVDSNTDFLADATVDYIFFDGKQLPINANVITPNEPGGMSFEDIKDKKCYGKRKNLDKVRIIAAHHDATISSSQAFKILSKRGLSTAWDIDPDGTIYQFFTDPAKAYQYATGKMNRFSIPFDVSTVADPRYAYMYKRKGMRVPPIITRTWNGKPKRMLALFTEQQRAAINLIKVLTTHLEIPLRVPKKAGKFIDGYDEYIITGPKRNPVSKFWEEGGGVVGHFHCSKAKWDPLMLDWHRLS